MRAAPRAADRGAALPSLGISYLISLAAGAPSHRPRFLTSKRPFPPPPTNAPAPQRCAAPLLRPSARASGSRAASSLHPRTPRSRRGTGARAAAAQQELHCERQPAPAAAHHKRTRTTAPRPAFHVPSHGLCRAGLGPREPQRPPPQRAVPCTAHRSQCTPPRSSYPPHPEWPIECGCLRRGLFSCVLTRRYAYRETNHYTAYSPCLLPIAGPGARRFCLKTAALAGDAQVRMGPQSEHYKQEERQRSQEAATWPRGTFIATTTLTASSIAAATLIATAFTSATLSTSAGWYWRDDPMRARRGGAGRRE